MTCIPHAPPLKVHDKSHDPEFWRVYEEWVAEFEAFDPEVVFLFGSDHYASLRGLSFWAISPKLPPTLRHSVKLRFFCYTSDCCVILRMRESLDSPITGAPVAKPLRHAIR